MDRIRIVGGHELRGEIPISGAKNAALPLMIASLLTSEPLTLSNVPRLADVKQLEKILENHGVDVAVHGRRASDSFDGQKMTLHAAEIVDTTAPYELVSVMRASFWVIGPLLARAHEARVSLPGGCAIGTRPVDLFLYGLRELGAQIDIDEGYVVARAPKGGLIGATVKFPKVSVGATHTIMMAATLARGTTVIENAAMEPEIDNVANCLVAMGAKISGIGTRTLTIEGVTSLHGANVAVIPDRIETGTFLCAVAATGGNVLLSHADARHLETPIEKLREAGVQIEAGDGWIRVKSTGRPKAVSLRTSEYPAFPTDMQAQFMVLNCIAEGTAAVTETIFENRFMHVGELVRLGAKIEVDGHTAVVHGVERLSGATVMATDLRASASLVIAGLVADGDTVVDRIYHLDRGYDQMEAKLRGIGADIERFK